MIWKKVRRLTECVGHLIASIEKLMGVTTNHNQIFKIFTEIMKEHDAEIAELKEANRALAQRLDNKTSELSNRIDKQAGVHEAR